MARKMPCIVIFEDDKRARDELNKSFKAAFKNTNIKYCFFGPSSIQSQKMYEERIKEDLLKAGLKNIGLIVCDRDLAGLNNYTGLSATNVLDVANELNIPICLYARGLYQDILEKVRRWSEFEIILNVSEGFRNVGNECKIILNGFQTIEGSYKSIKKRTNRTFADIISKILNRAYLKDKFALYGSGNEQMLAKILPYFNKNKRKIEDENRRIAKLLGYWLWSSIMRFPGVILNQTTTASFLNINEEQFMKRGEIQALFKKAIYKGPFGNIDKYWWRDSLEDILIEKKCEDGLQLAEKNKISSIKGCACSVDPNKRAGYYCMITEKPVSAEESFSNISWFPAGADLARISKPIFEELAPWIGLY